MILSIAFRLYLAQGKWRVGTHKIQWQLKKAGAWLQTMATTLDRLLHNRLIKTEVARGKNMIRWLIDAPVVDDNCPKVVRLNYQHQTRANVKENLIGLLKALGAKLEFSLMDSRFRRNDKAKSLFFAPVTSSISNSNASNRNDELEMLTEQLKK